MCVSLKLEFLMIFFSTGSHCSVASPQMIFWVWWGWWLVCYFSILDGIHCDEKNGSSDVQKSLLPEYISLDFPSFAYNLHTNGFGGTVEKIQFPLSVELFLLSKAYLVHLSTIQKKKLSYDDFWGESKKSTCCCY